MKTIKNCMFFLALLVASNVLAQYPTNGLVAYYPLNSNAFDLSGNNRHPKEVNATLTADRNGNSNAAYNFSAAAQNRIVYSLNDHPNFRLNTYTIAYWGLADNTFSQTHFPTAVSIGEVILSRLFHASGTNIQPQHVAYINGTYRTINGVTSAASNYRVWRHYAITFDGSFIRFYVDGALVSQGNFPGNITHNTLGFDSLMTIGSGADFASTKWFRGDIDDVFFYNRSMSQAGIDSLRNFSTTSVAVGPPLITLQPQSQTVCAGSNITLNVDVDDDTNVEFEWRINGNEIFPFANHSGVNSRTLQITNASFDNIAAYTCIVRRANFTFASKPAHIVVVPADGAFINVATGLTNYYSLDGLNYLADKIGSNNLTEFFTQSGFITQATTDRFNSANAARNLPSSQSGLRLSTALSANDFTVGFWYRHVTTAGPGIRIFLGTANQNISHLYLNQNEVAAGTQGGEVKTGVTLQNNTWHYLSYKRNGSEYSVFIDGVLVLKGTNGLPMNINSITAFGNSTEGGSNRSITGRLDNIRVYNNNISDAQVATLARMPEIIREENGYPVCIPLGSINTSAETQGTVTSVQWLRNGDPLGNFGNVSGATSNNLIIQNPSSFDITGANFVFTATNECYKNTSFLNRQFTASANFNAATNLTLHLPITSLPFGYNDAIGTNNGVTAGLTLVGNRFNELGAFRVNAFNNRLALTNNVTGVNGTLSFWFYFPGQSSSGGLLVSNANSGFNPTIFINANERRLSYLNVAANTSTVDYEFEDAKWYHLVVAKTGNNMKIYINNQLVLNASNAPTWTQQPIRYFGNSEQLSSGAINYMFDDIRFYSSELDADAVSGLYFIPDINTYFDATTPACAGNTVQFTANVSGNVNEYKWFRNNVQLNDGANVSGAQTATLTITNFQSPQDTGSYFVEAVNGCITTRTNATRTVLQSSTTTISQQPVGTSVCEGGQVTLAVTIPQNQQSGSTYQWLKNGVPVSTGGNIFVSQNAITISNATTNDTGNYSVVISRPGTCSITSNNANVTVVAAPSALITPSNPVICSGQSVTLLASGGNSYSWSNGLGTGASKTVSPTTNTTYTVTVTNSNNCSAIATATVTVNASPVASVSPSQPSVCNGDNITLTASGGASYAWSNSGGNNAEAIFTPTTTGGYSVTVTAANNCTAATTVLVTVNEKPNAQIGGTSPTICSGATAGMSATGGISFLWSNGLGNNANVSVTPVQTTTYTVTVTGSNGCTQTASRTITVNASPVANITPASPSICLGESITLNASGGTGYAWSNNGGSNAAATFSPTNNTTYTVTVTNANNCSATASTAVTVNSLPIVSITPVTASVCEGQAINLTATGGGTYSWSNSGGTSATATFSPTTTTVYSVTVSNNGCTATATRQVAVVAAPSVNISPAVSEICAGQSVSLTASGGNTYSWNTGQTSSTITVTPSATTTYSVTATGNSGCTATVSRTVTVNALPVAAITPASASICNGQSQQLTASGGTSYLWSNSLGSAATQTVTPASTTTYTVTVTNAANCTATATATVTVNNVVASINGPTTICSGLDATLTASGGNSYLWSNAATTTSITVSPTQTTTYTVTVTGAGNCTATATQTVSVQNAPTATISGNTTICNGESTTLTANGGNTYEWSNGATSASIIVSPTSNTTYIVTVSIGANCTATENINITVNQPSATTQIVETICEGSSFVFDGNTLTVANIYNATFTNVVGCDSTVQLTLFVTPAPVTTLDTTVCDGATINFFSQTITQAGLYSEILQTTAGCDSIVELNVVYLNPISTTVNAQICVGQTYEFDGQQLDQSNAYTATFTAASGCDSTVTLNLSVVTEITETVNASICEGESYLFDGQQLTIADTYTATFTSAGGCDSIVTLNLTINALPQPTAVANNADLSTQQFASYQWQLNGNDIQGADQQNYTATQNGDYSVKVTDANGCENTSDAVNVTIVGITNYDLGFTIYPNPTSGIVNIETVINNAEINIITLEGKVLFSQKATYNTVVVDLTGLAHGMYIIEMKAENAINRVRVVKE